MRSVLFVLLALFALPIVGACVQAADAANPDEPVEVTVHVDAPKRVIEVNGVHLLSDGIYNTGNPCREISGDGSYDVDVSTCCPSGWHPLALGPNGLLCEED